MKKIKILLIAFLTIFCINNVQAQTHISTGKYACNLVPASLGYEKYTCPACEAKLKKDKEEKVAEDKRRASAIKEKANAEKAARETTAASKKIEDKKNAHSGELLINGNSAPTYTSGNDPLAHSKTDDTTYKNPMTNTSSGSSALDYNKGVQQGQQILDAAAPLAQGLADIWNRKVEKENAFRENSRLMHEKKENDYADFCTKTNEMILYWPYFKENVIQRLPQILENESPSWESILGTDHFSNAFGKDASFIMENFKPVGKSKKDGLIAIASNILTPLKTPTCFWDFYAVKFDTYFRYKYNYSSKTEKLLNRRHEPEFIYNENKIVIGILIPTATSYDVRVRPLDYYKDIISKIGTNYVMLDANTFLFKDKLISFVYDAIHMYDLNYMGDQLYYKLSHLKSANPNSEPAKNFIYKNFGIMFNEKFNIDQNNIKWKPMNSSYLEKMKKNKYYKSNITDNQFIIETIDKDGICGIAGIIQGDIIKKVNNISTPNPFFFRLATYAYCASDNLNITYVRDGKEYETIINLN